MGMRLRNVLLGTLLCLMGIIFMSQSLPASSQTPPPSKGKPALYEFGARTCVSCIQMQKVIAELKASHGDQVEFRLVYFDEEKDLFRQYRIMLIPTQVFLDPSGKEVERHMGALTKEEVLQKLKNLKLID